MHAFRAPRVFGWALYISTQLRCKNWPVGKSRFGEINGKAPLSLIESARFLPIRLVGGAQIWSSRTQIKAPKVLNRVMHGQDWPGPGLSWSHKVVWIISQIALSAVIEAPRLRFDSAPKIDFRRPALPQPGFES
jgi:hypothetical protein